MTLLIFFSPQLYAAAAVPLFSSPLPPSSSPDCLSLLTQVHLQLNSRSFLLSPPQPHLFAIVATGYTISYAANKKKLELETFSFITIYHRRELCVYSAAFIWTAKNGPAQYGGQGHKV